jgi:hypothetical protein
MRRVATPVATIENAKYCPRGGGGVEVGHIVLVQESMLTPAFHSPPGTVPFGWQVGVAEADTVALGVHWFVRSKSGPEPVLLRYPGRPLPQ